MLTPLLFSQVFLQVIGVIAVAAVIIPWILIPVVPLLVVFLFLRCYFLQTSRDIKRLESTSNFLFIFCDVGLGRNKSTDYRNANRLLKKAEIISIKAKDGSGLCLDHTQFPQKMRVHDFTYNRKKCQVVMTRPHQALVPLFHSKLRAKMHID